ncbi:MAG TPA: DoxX family protein, partial [Candidatus Baltobacteraceae bacterium]
MSLLVGSAFLRFAVGIAFATHGTQKTLGWFGGYGLAGTGGFFDSLGLRPGRLFALAAGASEIAGGLLVATGFLGAVGPALALATMVVAMVIVHAKNGFFAQNSGIELPFVYAAAILAYAFTGYGPFSLDAVFSITALSTEAATWSILAIAL